MERIALGPNLRFRQAELGARIRRIDSSKMLKISAVSAGVILLFGITLFNLRNPTGAKASFGKISAPVAEAQGLQVVSPGASPVAPSMLGINIANNGSVFLRGARVSSISGGTLQVNVSWGLTDFAWTVETSATTKFFDHQGQKQTIAGIKVGDIVNVTGNLASNNNQFIINADFVRE